jgi:hypothetical protein
LKEKKSTKLNWQRCCKFNVRQGKRSTSLEATTKILYHKAKPKQQQLRIKKPSEKHQSPNNNKWQFKEITCEKSEAPINSSWEQKSQVGNVGHEDATLKNKEAKWNIWQQASTCVESKEAKQEGLSIK